MDKLIIKYLNDSLTPDEHQELNQWLENPDHKRIFEDYLRLNYDTQLTMQEDHTDEAYRVVQSKISNPSVQRLAPRWYGYAAAIGIVLILGLGFLYQQGYFNASPVLIPQVEDITLELGNGEIEIITPGTSRNILGVQGKVLGKQESDRLTYTPHSWKEELVYNTLHVPYGRTFEVILSDGTSVHLQAGTSLKFPTAFSNRGNRLVYLEGEAYFQVTEDKELPFIVVTDQLNVEVTGTAFNVSAYPEDIFIDVVLEEGGVGLYQADQTIENATHLSPGFIGSLDRRDNTITTAKVNTTIYTNWLEGKLTFRNMAFDNILQKLERHYNIEMVNHNQRLGGEIFNASFDKDETIENVLGYFNEIYKIEFTISDNTVLIQ